MKVSTLKQLEKVLVFKYGYKELLEITSNTFEIKNPKDNTIIYGFIDTKNTISTLIGIPKSAKKKALLDATIKEKIGDVLQIINLLK